jgi:D-inositol-3-phosphate glycosyltransferase
MFGKSLSIAMLSIHSDPLGQLGTQDTGGMSVYIQELSRELGRAGHHVDIFTGSSGERQSHEVHIADNARVIYLNVPESRYIPKSMLYSFLPDLWASLETYRLRNSLFYDLIHSHYWLSGQIGALAQKRWDVPHFLTLHTTGIAKKISCFQEREPARRLIAERRLVNRCDRILAPTEREKNAIIKYLQAPRDRIRLVPCGINLERFRPYNREKARNVLGLETEGALILYVGRFTPVKGMDRLMAAMGHLRRHRDMRLIIVGGDGNEMRNSRAIRRMSYKMNMKDAVMLRGRVDHNKLALYYSAANALVLPSYYESFGLVALESLACGTPVIASRVGAMDSIIHDGITGTVVMDPSPLSLAQAIEDSVAPADHSTRSREMIRRSVLGYNWTNVSSHLIEEYHGVLSDGRDQWEKQVLAS